MKTILFVLSIMTLMSYGCNRDQDATDSTRGMQQEESRSLDTPAIDNSNMDAENMDERDVDSQNMEARDLDSENFDTQIMDESNGALPSTSPSSEN